MVSSESRTQGLQLSSTRTTPGDVHMAIGGDPAHLRLWLKRQAAHKSFYQLSFCFRHHHPNNLVVQVLVVGIVQVGSRASASRDGGAHSGVLIG